MAPNINTPVKVFLLIFITLFQLADSLEKQDTAHRDHSHALYGLGTVTVLTALPITTSNTREKVNSGLTMNFVSPLDRVSVTNPMDSKWSTTARRSLGWKRR